MEFLYEMLFDRKAVTSLTSLFIAAATPIEGVATTNFTELAFVGEVCFAEGCDVDHVAHEFSGYEGRSSFWSSWLAGGHVEERSTNVPLHKGELEYFLVVLTAGWEHHQPWYAWQVAMEQAMFRVPFLALSSCYGSKQSYPESGCLVAQGAAEFPCCPD